MAEPAKKPTVGQCAAALVTGECRSVVLRQLEAHGTAAMPKTAPGPCICLQLCAAAYKTSALDPPQLAGVRCIMLKQVHVFEMTQAHVSVLARIRTTNLCGVTWLPGGCPCAACSRGSPQPCDYPPIPDSIG